MIKEKYIKLLYSSICKIYQFSTTFFENFLFKIKKAEKDIENLGYFKLKNNNLDLSYLMEYEPIEVNEYLSIRSLTNSQIIKLIKKVFDKNLRKKITHITGFKFSIDYLILYDRRHINAKNQNVPTLKQAYSYKWHFDKPNSSNMLKIIIPLNITKNHGPLKIIDRKESKKNKLLKPIEENKNIALLLGKSEDIYGFSPTLCIHKDGIPNKNLVASQIMFQLNPWFHWSINSKISQRMPQLKNRIRIWNDEPKFPFFAYRNDKRIPFLDN